MFIVFQPGFEFSTLKNPKNDTPLAFIVRCSGKWFLTSIWPPFVPEMTSIWPCLSENGYLVTLECSIIPNHPRMLDFKGPRKHLWFWRSWRSNGGQNEVGSIRRWHIRKIWAKIELCAKKTPNRLKTVTANPHLPLKCSRWNAPFRIAPTGLCNTGYKAECSPVFLMNKPTQICQKMSFLGFLRILSLIQSQKIRSEARFITFTIFWGNWNSSTWFYL